MKRAYRDLTDRERRARAEDEAFFELPGGAMRLDILCAMGVNGLRRIPLDQVAAPARKWFDDRGVTP